MKVFVTRDAAEFAQRAEDFLRRRPIEHNVLATVLATQEPIDPGDAPLIYQSVGYRRSTEAREYHFSVEGPVE